MVSFHSFFIEGKKKEGSNQVVATTFPAAPDRQFQRSRILCEPDAMLLRARQNCDQNRKCYCLVSFSKEDRRGMR